MLTDADLIGRENGYGEVFAHSRTFLVLLNNIHVLSPSSILFVLFSQMEDLNRQLAEKDEDLRIRAVQAKEMDKREDELQHKLKAQQSMYETMRAERNLAGKSLGEAEVSTLLCQPLFPWLSSIHAPTHLTVFCLL